MEERELICVDGELVQALEYVHQLRLDADRIALSGDARRAVESYEDADKRLCALAHATCESAPQAIGHRLETFCVKLGAAKLYTFLGEWQAAEASASGAILAGTLDGTGTAQALDLDLVSSGMFQNQMYVAGEERGLLAHRDVIDAFIYRSRARMRLQAASGARADALVARALAEKLPEAEVAFKLDAADALLCQAEMQLRMGANMEGAANPTSDANFKCVVALDELD